MRYEQSINKSVSIRKTRVTMKQFTSGLDPMCRLNALWSRRNRQGVVEAGLYKSESCSLITHGGVGDALPDERLQPFSVVATQVHKSDGKLAT